jgi:hypothetical protein
MVFLRNYSFAQIFVLLVISVIFQIIIFKGKPMRDPADNRFTFVFEVAVSIYLYVLLMLTDFKGVNTLRLEQGWSLVILTSSTVVINITVILKNLIQLVFRFIK